MAKDRLHVALLPWSAFGHIMPFFELAVALAKVGVHVSLFSTTRNIQRLPKLPPDAAGLVDLVAIPRPPIDPSLLPEDAEATVDIPFDKIQYLKIAYDLLKTPFEEFISRHSPSWIIADMIPTWAVEVAKMHNIPLINFLAFSASACVFFGPAEALQDKGSRPTPQSLTIKQPWVEFSSAVAFRKYEAAAIYSVLYEKDASGMSTGDRFAPILSGSKAVALRSCPEFEREYLNLYSKITGKPVIPLGFLPPEKSTDTAVPISDNCWKETFSWLDEQMPRSVVFVGFGSECKLSKEQVHTIADGLELSGLPFLWALRKPAWAEDEASDVLPLGFTNRVAGKGVVHIGWAPQKEILLHPAIGGSFFHSGWGSVIETLQHGHCLVVLPFIIDQGLNARFLVEKDLAIEVDRNEDDGSFYKEDIAKALRHAMVSSKGERLRANAKEVGSIFGDSNMNDGYIERFVEYLKNEKIGK